MNQNKENIPDSNVVSTSYDRISKSVKKGKNLDKTKSQNNPKNSKILVKKDSKKSNDKDVKIEPIKAKAIAKSLRISPRKLNLVASSIRSMKVDEALVQLTFSPRRIAKDVKKCLQSAIANAENNLGLDIDNLVITSSTVGKGLVMKRVMPRAKGRGAPINKFFSNLYITVSEEERK